MSFYSERRISKVFFKTLDSLLYLLRYCCQIQNPLCMCTSTAEASQSMSNHARKKEGLVNAKRVNHIYGNDVSLIMLS